MTAHLVDPAAKRKLEAAVFFNRKALKQVPAGRYQRVNVRGALHAHTGFERRFISVGGDSSKNLPQRATASFPLEQQLALLHPKGKWVLPTQTERAE